MNEQQLGPRPRPLSFEEVEAAGLPALFSAFDDLLIYKDGTVHALPSTAGPADLAQPEQLPGAYAVTQRVGIEHPWLHASGCPCRFCAPEADWQVAQRHRSRCGNRRGGLPLREMAKRQLPPLPRSKRDDLAG